MDDAIVIGAGPAGLQAALTLGRMHRSALVLDSGEYRNGPVAHMHNVIANDGTPPADFRRTARAQLEEYGTVRIEQRTAVAVAAEDDGFRVELADGPAVRGRRLVLATGLVDALPEVAGLAPLWGRRAFSCPFCDGHEFAGRRIAVIGTAAPHVLGMLRPLGVDATVFTVGAGPTDEFRTAVQSLGAAISSAPASAVTESGGDVVVHAGETATPVDGIFVAGTAPRQRAPFAAQLGLRMLPSGAVEIDDFGRTSVPGVFAAGDNAHRVTLPGVVASVVMAAAAGQMAAAAIVQELAAGH
ncbi:NAD(P)/FAD-dependent oxidoreductase [Streptomyces sp. MS2A]|nr:NAD(P)/FAD-dependent oxidoreductase [Streptomyces sp. MS2A]